MKGYDVAAQPSSHARTKEVKRQWGEMDGETTE